MQKGFIFTVDSILALSVAIIVAGALLFPANARPNDNAAEQLEIMVSDTAMANFYSGLEPKETLPAEPKALSLCRTYYIYKLNLAGSVQSAPTDEFVKTNFAFSNCMEVDR